MITIGTPFTDSATRMMLLGAGELGKEVAIEAQRYGIEVIAVDRYQHAPAMQVAHRSHVIDMLDGAALRKIVEQEQPHFLVPELEAIHTGVLLELEQEGFNVVPTGRATALTMDRESIRRLAVEKLGLPTAPFLFAADRGEFNDAVAEIGLPCVVKPVMSSSGKGQSVIYSTEEMDKAWLYTQMGGNTGEGGRVIVEELIDFDYEITLLTVRHTGGTSYCAPIGHRQINGDYIESWQPQPMSDTALSAAQTIAKTVTDELGGRGIFGVELFIKGDKALFSEVSPRPHDTGMVTLTSQNVSEFALHVRAILGLPILAIRQQTPAASAAIIAEGDSCNISYSGFEAALAEPLTGIRLFGKPSVKGRRRVGVALAKAGDIESARSRANKAAAKIQVILS